MNFLQPTYNVSESHGRLTVTLISTGTSAIDYDVRVTARGVTAQGERVDDTWKCVYTSEYCVAIETRVYMSHYCVAMGTHVVHV